MIIAANNINGEPTRLNRRQHFGALWIFSVHWIAVWFSIPLWSKSLNTILALCQSIISAI